MGNTLKLFAGLFAAVGLYGQAAVIRSVGFYEPSGTVLYSVYVASRAQALEDVTISSALPEGTRFLENVDMPKAASYEGVADDAIVWTIPAIAEDTVSGPFTFRVKLDGTQKEVPASAASAVAFQRPVGDLVEVAASPERLAALADSGSVTFDQRGTLTANGENGPVAVGGTGILFFVPEGAVTGRTTVTFRRLSVEDAKLPSNAAETWWCGLYQVAIEPQVVLSKTVAVVFPTRRPITPGLLVSNVVSTDLVNWQDTAKSGASAERNIGFGGGQFGGGGGCVSGFQQFGCGFGGFGGGFGAGCSGFQGSFGCGFGGFGITAADKVTSTISGATISQQFGQNVTAAGITDGTSNTIIAILIGRK